MSQINIDEAYNSSMMSTVAYALMSHNNPLTFINDQETLRMFLFDKAKSGLTNGQAEFIADNFEVLGYAKDQGINGVVWRSLEDPTKYYVTADGTDALIDNIPNAGYVFGSIGNEQYHEYQDVVIDALVMAVGDNWGQGFTEVPRRTGLADPAD